VKWLTICSSAEGKQGYLDGDGWNAAINKDSINSTAILIDADGEVGKAYGATNTPHMYVIDAEGNIAYHGAICDTPSTKSDDIAGATNYVSDTLDALIDGSAPPHDPQKAYGCSVKY
jgi:hypothetical protein